MGFSSWRSSMGLPTCSHAMCSTIRSSVLLQELKCENCGEISKRPSCVMRSEQVPLPNGKGTVNLIQKCKLCDRVGTVEIVSGQGKGKPLTKFQGQNNKYALLVVFDCHGLSPVEFSFGGQWKAESTTSKTTFEIDLFGGEFVEFDDTGECALSVCNLKFFRVAENWEDREYNPDPKDKKPEDYDDIRTKEIPNPDAKKPDDWDEEKYGEWTAPTIPNSE